jgi:peptide/nickel transport system substrate-binding protein
MFPMDTHGAPWSDIHVRRAVAYAINRANVIAARGSLPGTVRVSTIISPSQLQTLGSPAQVDAALKSVPQYPFDLSKAKQEMAASAYPHGFNTTFDTISLFNYLDILQVIAADLAKIGIHATVNVMPIGAWFNEITRPRDQITAQYNDWGCSIQDPCFVPSIVLGARARRADSTGPTTHRPPSTP